MKSYLPLCLLLCLTVAVSSSEIKLGGNWWKSIIGSPLFKRPFGNKNCPKSSLKKFRWKADMKFEVCLNSKLKPPKLTRFQSNRIKRLFPGLFVSLDTYRSINKHVFGAELHDNDACCPTVRLNPKNETMLQNIHGEWKCLVHLSTRDMPQWVTKASCLTSTCGSGKGQCTMENTVHFFLVWDLPAFPALPFMFDAFAIPTYCSCKNVLPSA